jgi:hypothetical protein
MTSLHVEIWEREIVELTGALQEGKTKNVYLTGIVEEQKKYCYTYFHLHDDCVK